MIRHTMSKAIVNLTTKEYFIYSNEKDKIKTLNKLTGYTAGTKMLTFLLQFYDKNITYDNCGECYWNNSDEIKDNMDVESLDNTFDKVPEHFIK